MAEQEYPKIELTGKCLKNFEPPQPKKLEKVAIMGFAPSWVHMPFKNPEFEFWTLNEAYRLLNDRPDAIIHRWFEIHNQHSPSKCTPEHQEFLKSCACPLYTRGQVKEFPASIAFPFEAVVEWGKKQDIIGYRYHTNSISWMIAFALMQGFKELHVYGVDMAQDDTVNGTSEYAYQKPCCEYWLGIAKQYTKVYIPDDCDLLKCKHLYGLESDNTTNVWLKKQIKELDKRGKHFAAQEHQAKAATFNAQMAQAELRGATSAYRQVLKGRI